MTRLARRVPLTDETSLLHAIIKGLRENIRQHVLQANVHSVEELLETARIAEVATSSTTDQSMAEVLEELRASNRQHQQHAAAFQQLSSRLDKLNLSPIQSSETRRRSQSRDRDRDRSFTPPRHVTFEGHQHRRSPSPAPYRRRPPAPSSFNRDRRPPPPSPRFDNYRSRPMTSFRGGRSQPYRGTSQNVTCWLCGTRGHKQYECRQRRNE